MPFETIALDFITKLPESQGYDSILTIMDHDCTKATIFIPCREEINAEGTAALYIQHIFAHFGLPQKVISDRDPCFMSKFMQEVCCITGIEHNPSTAYHPRTDGQSEHSNQWVETAICFISDYHQTNWAPYLPIAQFAHNNWPSDTMQKSPFFLLMGYNLRTDWILAPSPLPQVTMRLEQLKQARDTVQQLMIKAQQSWVKNRDTPKYKEGDQVWLEGKNLCINQPTAKLVPRRHGPFKVIKVLSLVSYQLALPTQWSIHPVFHIDLLTPYKETIMHGPNYQHPVPDLVDGEEEYSVEKILDSRKFGRRRCLQYLVKWEGYPDSDNMWVDKDDVFTDDKVREFKCSNPAKEIHIRSMTSAKSPHSSASIHSHLLLQHARRYMSSNGHSDLADEPTAGVYADSASGDKVPVIQHIHNLLIDTTNTRTTAITAALRAEAAVFSPRPRSLSDEAAEVAQAFRAMSIHTPAPHLSAPTTNNAAEEGHYEVSIPEQNVVGYEDRSSMASGTAAPRQEEVGPEELTVCCHRSHSVDSSHADLTPCPQCREPREYCHDHNPPVPIPEPVVPLPIAELVCPVRMATLSLNCEEAEVLAGQLATALG
jgi:hypothetical protein